MATKKVQTSFRIDQQLLSAFQHKLVDRNTSMTAVLEELIGRWVDGADPSTGAGIVHLEPVLPGRAWETEGRWAQQTSHTPR